MPPSTRLLPPLAFLVLLALGAPASLGAQTSGSADSAAGLPLRAGARVRVESAAAGLAERAGTLTLVTRDSLRLRPDSGTEITIPATAVDRVELSVGRTSRGKLVATGLGIGTVLGLAMGLKLATLSDCDFDDEDDDARAMRSRARRSHDPDCTPYMDGDTGLRVTAILGALGALVGVSAGASAPTERWQRIALPFEVGVGRPGGGRRALVVGARVSFR